MKARFLLRWRDATLAAAAGLAVSACSGSAPPPTLNVAPVAAPATTGTEPIDHAAMGGTHAGKPGDPAAPMASSTVDTVGTFGSGKPVSVTLHVADMMSGKPMGAEDFVIAHTEKVHVLGLDPGLTDYSHSHPIESGKPGDWSFQFTPKFDRPYHLWLDVTPIGGSQQFVMLTVNEKAKAVPVERKRSMTATVGDVSATLRFDAPLTAGQAAMGHLAMTRNGKPFEALEPVMGAYGHIVAISDDWTSIAHVHPMGTEPTRDSDRGGPTIDFHLEPSRAGFLKIFAQVRVDGQDVFLPFGTIVTALGHEAQAP